MKWYILIIFLFISCAHNEDKWFFHKRTIEAQKLYNYYYKSLENNIKKYGLTKELKIKKNRLSIFREAIKNYGDKTSKRQIPFWEEIEIFEKQMRIWKNELNN